MRVIVRALLSPIWALSQTTNKNPALRQGDVYLVPGIEWHLGVIR